MTLVRRHALDFSPPRLSDLPPDDARRAMLARAEQARDTWLRSRQHRPLAERVLSIFRGAPSLPGAGGMVEQARS